MKKFLFWFHNFFDLHDWVYSNPKKVLPCTRFCKQCPKKQTMIGNNDGTCFIDDKILEDVTSLEYNKGFSKEPYYDPI